MAIFHSHVQVISRGKGKSAVAAAAYRAGELIKNEYDGQIHNYTRKGGVIHTEILLPGHAPDEYADRAVLWNAVEKIEKAKNSQLARELDIALPTEFAREQNIALVRDYVKRTFVDAGMCADLCVHDKGEGNPHAHIMLTMRPINEDGSWGGKQKKEYILNHDGGKIYDPQRRQYKCRSIPSTDWNDRGKADEWRKDWEDAANAELERLGYESRIDRRTYEEQGVEKIPTVHMGAAASQMERKGIRAERGDINRSIEVTNQHLRQLKARIVKLQTWLKEETGNAEPPSLAEVVANILSQKAQPGKSGRYQSVANLKAASKMLNFLQENQIKDMAGLEEKVKSMYGTQLAIRDQLKPMERRLKVLDEHIQQASMYMQYKAVYRQYQEQKPKKQAAFAEKHHAEITLFESAERYLKGVMNGKTTLPMKVWRMERAELGTERNRLNQDYISLKDEIRTVEQIKKNVTTFLKGKTQTKMPTREWDIEQ